MLMSRCLAYDPDQRFQTAAEMLEAIKLVEIAGKSGRRQRPGRITPRRAWFGALLILLLAACASVLTFVTRSGKRSATPEPSKNAPVTESTTLPATQREEWVRIFCSSGPGIWNTDLDVGDEPFAIPLAKAPREAKYLRMSLVDQSKHVIIPMKYEYLAKAKNMGGYTWVGDKRQHKGMYEFGIVNNSWGATYRSESHVSIAGKRGWGWGTSPPGLTYPHAAFSWNGTKTKKAVVSIDVKTGSLTDEEKRHLLR